jgi:hypothetical protein
VAAAGLEPTQGAPPSRPGDGQRQEPETSGGEQATETDGERAQLPGLVGTEQASPQGLPHEGGLAQPGEPFVGATGGLPLVYDPRVRPTGGSPRDVFSDEVGERLSQTGQLIRLMLAEHSPA